MPIGAVALLVFGFAIAVNWVSSMSADAYEYERLETVYHQPMVLEAEDSPAPAYHPLADSAGIIPAVGESYPGKPDIFGTLDPQRPPAFDLRGGKLGEGDLDRETGF